MSDNITTEVGTIDTGAAADTSVNTDVNTDADVSVDYDALEQEALNGLTSGADNADNIDSADEIDSQEPNNSEANTNTENNDNIDINSMDLSFLGINQDDQSNNDEANDNTAQQQQGQGNNLDELKQMIQDMNKPANEQNNNIDMPEEEVEAVKTLFDKFQKLGLIPENNGINEEQQKLLEDVKKMNEAFKQQQEEQQQFQDHQEKLTKLESFDKELAETIPGYDSKMVEKAVADINKTNPDAAMKIFNDPSLLIKLWREIGGKAQPSTKQQNIISTKTTSANNRIAELEKKVNNGTATEYEEAEFLNML